MSIVKIPQPGDAEEGKDCMAVIVTICQNSSYDALFTKEPQTHPEGRVAVFRVDYQAIPGLHSILKKEPDVSLPDASLKVADQLITDMQSVDPEAIVFNFECCAACSDTGFGGSSRSEIIPFTHTVLKASHMAMFSDFSLKALIHSWDDCLGPNPFKRASQDINSGMILNFIPSTLKASPSSQLETVADLCVNGEATIHAEAGTIMYTVLDTLPQTDAYKLEVLSVVSKADGCPPRENLITVSGTADGKPVTFKGTAGHVALTYPSGGVLLTSCGHWIELANLDTSKENLKAVMVANMGEQAYSKFSSAYEQCGAVVQEQMLQQACRQNVFSSAPCKYKKSA